MTDYYTCRECHGYIFSCGCREKEEAANIERLRDSAKQNNALARHESAGRKRADSRAAELANALECLCDDAEAAMNASGNRQAENTIIACRELLRRNDAANEVCAELERQQP